MDMNKLLKRINNLNEYVLASRDLSEEHKNAKIQFNMTTVLALKKIRSYEIEYFNKYDENGIACAALQVMLDIAPSKTWGVLGKDIVNLIKYWLDAIRKHLISHSSHWWTFLKLLVKFIREIRLKDPNMPNQLVEHTAECLLDLASNNNADAFQKHEILHCLNMYCAESNREIRFAMRNKLGVYFTKLSLYMGSCDHFPSQLCVLETLLRWLVPRHDAILRSNSADKWFPTTLYCREAVDVFLERPWINFFQDARDFLNIHNKATGLVVSFICRRLSIGKIVIISGNEKHVSWLDINRKGKCMSVLLDPQVLATFGHNNLKSWETLLVTDHNTQTATLDRESHQVIISLTLTQAPQAYPSMLKITNEPSKDIKIAVSSKSDLTVLNKALNEVFGEKYQLVLNLAAEVNVSPESSTQDTRNYSHSEEDNRFSHPVVVRRGRHSGYIARSRNVWKSPSTASTSSLAQLHDRLAALPSYKYDKEPVSVCARPELSSVTEVSETDDRHSFQSATTLKLRSYGVCYRPINKAQGDGKPKSDDHKKVSRRLSPAIREEAAPSCLLVATIGSTDDSVINSTIEKLAQSKDYEPKNIVDLLIKEALEDKPEDLLDSGINTGENKKTDQEDTNCEAIVNTPHVDDIPKISGKKSCTVVSKSTSDESNTEEIDGTPVNYVNTRRRKTIRKKKVEEGCSKDVETNVFDAQAVEAFFNEHFTENSAGEVVISPTLAKKINETSSESSDNFDDNMMDVYQNTEFDVDNSEIIKCLNCIVDKVCEDFDKYTDYIDVENKLSKLVGDVQEASAMDVEVQENLNKHTSNSLTPQKSSPKPIKGIKLKYKITPNVEKSKKNVVKKTNSIAPIVKEIIPSKTDEIQNSSSSKTKATKNTKKTKELKLKSNEMTKQFIEEGKENVSQNNNAVDIQETNTTQTKPDLINDIVPDIDTPLIRRKRKLYSPKAETHNEQDTRHNSETEGDNTELKTTLNKRTSSSTFYKEIENERKKQTRKSRARKSKVPETESPRTLKMNQVFDKLKETVESNENITLADKTYADMDVYNFSSDSEEEYFKKKKIVVRKRPSDATMGSFESAISTRHGRVTKKINYTENVSSNDEGKNQTLKRSKVVRKYKPRKRKVSVVNDLEDERMRQAPPENLNTSIIVEHPTENTYIEVEPVLIKPPQLEAIIDIDQNVEDRKVKNKSVKKNKKLELSLKKGNKSNTNSIDIAIIDDRTESPLPGLVVEQTTACIDDNNDSVTGTMLQKFKKIYRDGFDTYVNDTNTTQNLLSDVDKINNSQENNAYVADEVQTDNSFSRTETKSATKRNAKSVKSKKKLSAIYDCNEEINPQDVINISEAIKAKSEESITSKGINAHGDMDEVPPSPTMIKQQVEPRNLELDNLEKSLKDYFDHLRRQITNCDERDTSHENLDNSRQNTHRSNRCSEDNLSDKSKSVKVVVSRLPEKEINKWVSSDKSESSEDSRKIKKYINHRQSYNFKNEKSPVVSVTRMSSDEMEKWFHSCNNSHKQESFQLKEKPKAKVLDVLYESHKWLPSHRNSSSDVESEQNNQRETNKSMVKRLFKTQAESMSKASNSSNEILTRCKLKQNEDLSQKDKSRTKLNHLFNNIDSLMNARSRNIDADNDRKTVKSNLNESTGKENDAKSDIQKRTSVISPIKIGNFLSQSNKISKTKADEDEYVKRVRNIFSEGARSITTNKKLFKDRPTENDVSSPNSTSTKIESSRATKRKTVSTTKEVKKQKLEVTETISESGPSISSVAEWFRRNEPTCSRDETMQSSLLECVQSIAEKLDTTLVDINQNTSKKFIDLFVEAQKQLDEHKARRRSMYRQAASDMLSQIVAMMDHTFSELDNRSQEMDKSFMEQLRSRASQMIVEDSKQKQAMVQIMKEDVKAVVDYINRNK